MGQVYVDLLQLNRFALIGNRLERQRLSRMEEHLAEMTVTLRSILAEIEKVQTHDRT